jgi:exopolyphosphatase/guanosine-5'-triphosphate,3'-diphosphate pyrophosphatase
VKQQQMPESQILAAVDLGSNSFHMIVARLSHGQPKVIDRLREMVRLAAGLDDMNHLDAQRQQIALDCLGRFGERIRDIHADSVRVVGTNTLRKLRRSSDFVDRAATCLGHPVEVISGIEEARLIYQGVIQSSPSVDGVQLVADIGGGSTEIIRGRGSEPDAMESLNIGCVGLSLACFASGKLSKRCFERARIRARLELEPIRLGFRRLKPERVMGASGTVRAAHEVINAAANKPADISIEGLESVIHEMTKAGNLDRLDLPGLSEQRKPVFPGGIAILIEVMSALGIDRMQASDGALREGIIYDMVGRLSNEDARTRTVRSMEGRFNIDTEQADRVEAAAMALLDQVAATWKIDLQLDRKILRWAARLHEVGLHISHSQYHLHGAYLLANADMPGFPTEEQQVLARLVGGHRGKLKRKSTEPVPKTWSRRAKRLTVLLRLAALFNRSRTNVDMSEIVCGAKGRKLVIEVSHSRLDSNPLTWADLEREEKYLADAGVEMTLLETSMSAG